MAFKKLNFQISNWLTKLEYGSPRWQVSFAVSSEMCDKPASRSNTESCKAWTGYYATDLGDNAGTGNATSYSTRAYWVPEESGAIPSISVGYDIRTIDDDGLAGSVEEQAAWMVGLNWTDAFIDGNRVGLAFGQRMHATEIVGGAEDPAEDNFVWEAYYDYKVSDNVTVTPTIFGGTDVKDGAADDSDDIFGAVLLTTFKF